MNNYPLTSEVCGKELKWGLSLLNDRVLYQLTIDFLLFWRQEEADSLQKL